MDSNQQGRARAFAVLTPIRRGIGKPRLRVVLATARRTGFGTKTLMNLRMLYVARFGFVDDLPGEQLPHRYFLFESNFNGSWDRYIDTFSYILARGMRALWGACPGFPGAKPTTRFKEYIRGNELRCDHYYVAYPEASARTVLAALELQAGFDEFRAAVRGKDAQKFEAEWKVFLDRYQQHV